MKTCTKCKYEKPLESFSWKNKSKGTYSTICKMCHSEYSRQHYKEKPELYSTTVRPAYADKVNVRRNKLYILEYLLSHPCECGEVDLDVLEFDHIIPLRKRGSRIANHFESSLQRLQDEINKCVVRCASCHAKKTRLEDGESRYVLLERLKSDTL